jgi:hypothetical protein
MMHVGNNTTEESNQALKRTKKVHGVIEYEYIEKQLQKYFSLYALVAPTFRVKQLAWPLCGDLKSLVDPAAEIFLNDMTGKGSIIIKSKFAHDRYRYIANATHMKWYVLFCLTRNLIMLFHPLINLNTFQIQNVIVNI